MENKNCHNCKEEFTIDADDSASGSLTLRFGTTLSKELTYDQSNGWFNFNDDVRIEGSLTVTGLINGIDIATLGDSVDTHLKVASGAGLTWILRWFWTSLSA